MGKKPDMPLVKALGRYARKNPVRFHMPGHKGGSRVFSDFGRLFRKNLFRWDVTEIPGLDDLHEPCGVIEKAEQKLARLYGADKSYFLVNGSTSGILAMMGACLNRGDSVIISRASHRSVMSGLVLTGAKPVYVMPGWHRELGVYTQITPGSMRKVVKQNPGARVVVVTNPTYQGFCPDLRGICEIARESGMLVLVDEAHGPHLAFSRFLPPSAGDFDVDGWVQSPHKMLSSLTQSAWLHVKGGRIDEERLASYVGMVTSTSPSYLLMASLDYARAAMESRGRHLAGKALGMAEEARNFINTYTGFYCVGKEIKGAGGIFDIDLSRLIVNVSVAGFTGFEVESLLRREFNIYAEYADLCNVYFLITFGNTNKDIKILQDALRTLSYRDPKDRNMGGRQDITNPGELLGLYSGIMKKLPQKAMEPGEAFARTGEWMPLKRAAGRVVKKAVVPYPPGVPLLMPGEIVEDEHADLIENLVESGCTVQGVRNDSTYVVLS